MKKVVKLTEYDLHRVINNSVNRVLKEGESNNGNQQRTIDPTTLVGQFVLGCKAYIADSKKQFREKGRLFSLAQKGRMETTINQRRMEDAFYDGYKRCDYYLRNKEKGTERKEYWRNYWNDRPTFNYNKD